MFKLSNPLNLAMKKIVYSCVSFILNLIGKTVKKIWLEFP